MNTGNHQLLVCWQTLQHIIQVMYLSQEHQKLYFYKFSPCSTSPHLCTPTSMSSCVPPSPCPTSSSLKSVWMKNHPSLRVNLIHQRLAPERGASLLPMNELHRFLYFSGVLLAWGVLKHRGLNMGWLGLCCYRTFWFNTFGLMPWGEGSIPGASKFLFI